MTELLRDWMPLIAPMIGLCAGVIAAKWNRKSQVEANHLTGSGQVFTQQGSLLQDIQEERDSAKAELKEEREQHKRDFAQLRKDFDDFKKDVEEQVSGYRAYIHGLRGQVHELGGIPIKWPVNLKQ